jgi:ATP-dependent Lhr-like helicase
MGDHPAFHLLHRGLQLRLWKMQWPELRPLQVEAIRHLTSTTAGHVILSAATAAGKTEAAFLPILSAIADDAHGSVRVIYVGPLKALINDQFARVEDLCREMDVPVHRWHGDVPAAAKKRLVERPGGVLLITPESLESLFVNRSAALARVLGGVRFVVVDELHAFLGNERGLHLRSLLYRLAAMTVDPPRIVGLSATLGDPLVARRYLDADHPDAVAWIAPPSDEVELKLKVYGYVRPVERPAEDDDTVPAVADAMTEDLLAHCGGHTNLVFTNARNDVELYGERCRRLAADRGLPDQFLVHHGSLGAELRRDVEQTIKAAGDGRPVTAFCTSTLEMGIDIGQVRMVGQIGAPHSVASAKQRAGRSGRRPGEPRILRMYVPCDAVDDKTNLFRRLHLDLVRAVAIVELMRAGWSEPADPSTFDLSVLTQQVISCIAERGGDRADRLHGSLCAAGAFREVTPKLFAGLLRQLGHEDVIEQTPQGELILGLEGERLRKDKGFYAVFPTADAYAVLHDGQRIGAVAEPPPPGHHLLLAARRWAVVDVDLRRQAVYVVPSRGYKPAIFRSGGGDVHREVARRMQTVLAATDPYAYLDPTAAGLLAEARGTAARTGVCRDRLVTLGHRSAAVMTWAGSIATGTLEAMLKAEQVGVVNHDVGLQVDRSAADCRAILARLTATPPAATAFADHLTGGAAGKYDHLLGDDLRREVRVRRRVDVPAALADPFR